MVQTTFHCLNVSSIRKTALGNIIGKLAIATTIASASTFTYLSSNTLTQASAFESENSNPYPVEDSHNSDINLGHNLSIDNPSANNLGEPLNANCPIEFALTPSPAITSADRLPVAPTVPNLENNQSLSVTTPPDASDVCSLPDQTEKLSGGFNSRDAEFRHIEDTINHREFSWPDRPCSHANQAILLCVPLQGF